MSNPGPVNKLYTINVTNGPSGTQFNIDITCYGNYPYMNDNQMKQLTAFLQSIGVFQSGFAVTCSVQEPSIEIPYP